MHCCGGWIRHLIFVLSVLCRVCVCTSARAQHIFSVAQIKRQPAQIKKKRQPRSITSKQRSSQSSEQLHSTTLAKRPVCTRKFIQGDLNGDYDNHTMIEWLYCAQSESILFSRLNKHTYIYVSVCN